MSVTSFIPTDFIHPHIYHNNISQCKTKQCDLFLQDFFLRFSLSGVKTFSIDDIKVCDILIPYTLSASFSVLLSVQYRKLGTKCAIHKCTFSGTLSSENSYSSWCVRKLPQLLTIFIILFTLVAHLTLLCSALVI